MSTIGIIGGIGAALMVALAGCSRLSDRDLAMSAQSNLLVVVEFHLPSEAAKVERSEVAVVNKVREWLAAVMIRQPKEHELGAVMPWCTVSFFDISSGAREKVSETAVYLHRDSTEIENLLMDSEIQALRKILGM